MNAHKKQHFYTIIVLNKLKQLKIFSNNVILLCIISGFIYIIFAAFAIYSFSHVSQLTNADAAMILGASVWNDRPSPVFRERINHGIWLYKNGYAKNLIFTGGFGTNSNISESSVARNFAIRDDVPAENIFIEEVSRTTIENIYYASNIITENNFDTIIIVSDPLHMKRSVTIAKDLRLNVFSSPTPTTRYISRKAKLDFLAYEWFYYITYKIYKHLYTIFLCIILYEVLFSIYYRSIFRQGC